MYRNFGEDRAPRQGPTTSSTRVVIGIATQIIEYSTTTNYYMACKYKQNSTTVRTSFLPLFFNHHWYSSRNLLLLTLLTLLSFSKPLELGQQDVDRIPSPRLMELGVEIIALLKERKESICIAETAAGGLISATLLSIPGASAVYRGWCLLASIDRM